MESSYFHPSIFTPRVRWWKRERKNLLHNMNVHTYMTVRRTRLLVKNDWIDVLLLWCVCLYSIYAWCVFIYKHHHPWKTPQIWKFFAYLSKLQPPPQTFDIEFFPFILLWMKIFEDKLCVCWMLLLYLHHITCVCTLLFFIFRKKKTNNKKEEKKLKE